MGGMLRQVCSGCNRSGGGRLTPGALVVSSADISCEGRLRRLTHRRASLA
jgi:hypothetical protein